MHIIRKTRKILITNDDGYNSPGILALAKALSKKWSVTVVAPDRERSAIGHGLSFFCPLRVNYVSNENGYDLYTSDGTPTDCILLGICSIMDTKPDLVVSGINRGANLGYDVTYSGTVSAAMEGAIQSIPSIAVSLASFDAKNYDFAAAFSSCLAEYVLAEGLAPGIFLNVNVPAVESDKINGVAVTHQGKSLYRQTVIKRMDPRGKEYFWIGGEEPQGCPESGSDFEAVQGCKISITPMHLFLTGREYISTLGKWELFKNFSMDKIYEEN